jgi:NitT/TauT family transport system ATP-binding protein
MRTPTDDVITPAISLKNVDLDFDGAAIFNRLSFQVERGKFVSILGPSGCGKSTSLRIIGGLLQATAGEVVIGGVDQAYAWEKIAYVFQSPRLLPWKNTLDNAAFGLEMRSPELGVKRRREIAKEQLIRVGLGADIMKMPAMLSGGERQRVAIARALALSPEIILMDEPFSALDPNTRIRLRQQLIDLWVETGKTIVFVTHDVDEALEMSDRVIVLGEKPKGVIADFILDFPRPRAAKTSEPIRQMRQDILNLFGGNEIQKET